MDYYYKDKIPKSEQEVIESLNHPYFETEKGHVVRLILCNEKYTSVQENLVNLKHLEILDLSINKRINPLSESIGYLRSLKKLYLNKRE